MVPFHGESEGAFSRRVSLGDEAREFLLTFKHCRGVVRMCWGDGEPPHVGAMLCETDTTDEHEFERFVWVVAGDLPPMVVSTRRCRNVFQAFAEYCDRNWTWIRRVRAGEVPDISSPGGPSNQQLVELLEPRLRLIEECFIEPNRWLLAAPTAADRKGAENGTDRPQE
jgi:hypothetical protein